MHLVTPSHASEIQHFVPCYKEDEVLIILWIGTRFPFVLPWGFRTLCPHRVYGFPSLRSRWREYRLHPEWFWKPIPRGARILRL